MPYPNEHACRLHPPSRYERFRRSTRRSAGKVYSVIFGIKSDGTSEEQAYRYNKNTWTTAQARAHCQRHDGTFEAAREGNSMENITANIDGQVRMQIFDGRAHFVMPVVLLVEGVHSGSAGSAYYSPEDLMASAHLWNGIPVPVQHPENSANEPDVIEERVVGRLFNVHFDDKGNKLRGEIYLDPEKTRRVSTELLDAIRNNEHIEVSTGMYFDAIYESGDWHGEHYDIRATNFHPDHLALLPGQVGACSWQDGCGIRANKSKKGDMRVNENSREVGFMDKMKSVAKSLAAACGLTTLETSHEDIRAQLQAQLDAMDNAGWVHYVRDIYDNDFVYEALYRGDNPSDETVTGAAKYYRRGYQIDDDDQVTMKDEPVEVRESREWVAMSEKSDKKTTEKHKSKHEEESNMEKKKVIDELIDNEKTKFVDEDRKWLDGFTDEQLAKIVPCADEEDEETKKNLTVAINTEIKNDKPNDPPDPKLEDNAETDTVESYVAKAPPEIASLLKRAVAAENARKEKLVKELTDNKRCEFTKEQLEAKDVAELEQLTKLAGAEADYSGQGGAPATNAPKPLGRPDYSSKDEKKK